MKIGIIGYGVVGKAIANSYDKEPKYKVEIYDPMLGFNSDVSDCDAVFVCVPSPSLPDGACDSSILESALQRLGEFKGVIISKTTATPDVYIRLQKQYPNLVHAPEFLTQNNAREDYQNGRLLVLGGNEWYRIVAHGIIKQSVFKTDVFYTDIGTASLFKYIVNSFLATKVIAMNQYRALADSMGLDWSELAKMLAGDPRIGSSHLQVPGPDGQFGFGGMCFPKDIEALLNYAERQNINLELLSKVVNINNTLRK